MYSIGFLAEPGFESPLGIPAILTCGGGRLGMKTGDRFDVVGFCGEGNGLEEDIPPVGNRAGCESGT
jgi:hypothetical protein